MAVTEEQVNQVLKTVFDPEIPVNIYELGLIYDVSINDSNEVLIKMTLTTPNCPAAASLPSEIQQKVSAIEGVQKVDVEIVWEPMWSPAMMSEAARLQLGL